MKASISILLIVFTILNLVSSFVPYSIARTSSKSSTIVMDGKARVLRDRIVTVKNTRRITEAMRLVAAARVRRAQEAVLRSRPLLHQLQLVFNLLAIKILYITYIVYRFIKLY